jgi:hypothetical protein
MKKLLLPIDFLNVYSQVAIYTTALQKTLHVKCMLTKMQVMVYNN